MEGMYCREFGCDRTTAWHHWQAALTIVVSQLNSDAEPGRHERVSGDQVKSKAAADSRAAAGACCFAIQGGCNISKRFGSISP